MPVGLFRGVELTGLEIRSKRLLLRPWQRDDAPAIAQIMQSRALHTFIPLPDPYTLDDAVDFVTRMGQVERERGTGLDCAVIDDEAGRLVGSASLRLPFALRDADIGYWIAPDARGRRYAAEATDALAGWAYEHEVHRVEVRTDVANLVSARVALRAGFGFEGLRREALCTDGKRHATAVFVRTADDPGDPVAPTFPPLPPGGLTDGVVSLREPVPEDITGFTEQEDDPLTRQVVFTAEPRPRSAMVRLLARARMDWLVGHTAQFSIVDVQTGRFAGSLHLRTTGPPQIAGIGYVVHPDFRGRGYTTRALRLVADWAFAQGGFVRLELGTKEHNIASQRAASAAGFQPDGVAAARLRNADGTFSAEVRYALLHPDYR